MIVIIVSEIITIAPIVPVVAISRKIIIEIIPASVVVETSVVSGSPEITTIVIVKVIVIIESARVRVVAKIL